MIPKITPPTPDFAPAALPQSGASSSRRNWLKGLGALVGMGVLAAPTSLLASPVAEGAAPLPASALVGGEEYIGMVQLLTNAAMPQGWLPCDGRELAISQYPALFAVLGAVYGGNGRTTFALPDLREAMQPDPAQAPQPLAATATPAPQPHFPDYSCAIKVANAAATTTAVAELRLRHSPRSQAHRSA